MKIILLIIIGLTLLFALIALVGRIVNTYKYKIRPETGVQKTEYIAIGAAGQYIQIRGQNIFNPVLIVLHGGPGNPMACDSYRWQAALEHNYTIVHWDQRGCGNTFYHNRSAKKPTLELLLSDLNELVDDIRFQYGKEKVVIMGHSWGTFLGGIYAKTHPDKVSAYISVSQMLDFKKSEQVSAQEAIRVAKASGRTQDVREIKKLLAAVMACRTLDKANAKKLLRLRLIKEKYLPPQYGRQTLLLRLFSPYMTIQNLKWMMSFGKLIESNSELYEMLLSHEKHSIYHYAMEYKVPIIMISGNWDWTTPYRMAYQYFNDISAPKKKFITIGNTGHIPFMDKPEEFSETLLKALRNT